ncbi:DUF1569 domain-containing protein [Bernardetia sp. OM2101]|uniref:DUF1569 domain-containing protein n=1 Tax=Bernardetia sp. OM2101 TaxID=3344876 RepID=UPI0035D010A4
MSTQTVSQLGKELSEVVEQYYKSLQDYSNEDFEKTFDDDSWSMAQLYNYLFSSSRHWINGKIMNCIHLRKGVPNAELTKEGSFILDRGYISHTKKVKIPNGLPQPEPLPKAFFEKELSNYSAYLEDLVEQINNQIEPSFGTKHPIFGMLTAKNWLTFDLIHWKHHLRQQKEIEAKF